MAVFVISKKNGERLTPTVHYGKVRRRLRSGKAVIYSQSGNFVVYNYQRHVAVGCHCNGSMVILDNKKSVKIANTKTIYHVSGWKSIKKEAAG